MKRLFWWAFILLAILWSAPAWEGSGRDLKTFENVWNFLTRFFPPDWTDIQAIGEGLRETIQISLLATGASAVLSMLLGLFGAPWMPKATQGVIISLLAMIRSVPSLIWAVVAVAIVGPHPRAGVLALTFYSVGYLGKFLLDDFRTLDLNLLRTYQRWGLHPIQAFQYGFWPQLRRRYFAHCLWMFEYNVRSASIIGYVGAGGLGLHLHAYQEYGQWNRFCAVLIIILGIVLIFEMIPRVYKVWAGRDMPKEEPLAAE